MTPAIVLVSKFAVQATQGSIVAASLVPADCRDVKLGSEEVKDCLWIAGSKVTVSYAEVTVDPLLSMNVVNNVEVLAASTGVLTDDREESNALDVISAEFVYAAEFLVAFGLTGQGLSVICDGTPVSVTI